MGKANISETLYRDYFNALITGNRKRCVDIVQDLLAKHVEIYDLYILLFQKALYEVGNLWEKNAISVAVEHLATGITESLLSLVYPRIFAADHIGKRVVIACVVNEYHQIGAKMVTDIFELHGWDSYFLGANTPHAELLRFIDDKKPDLIGFSLAIYTNLDKLLKAIDMVRARFSQMPIIVGGQAFQQGDTEPLSRYKKVTYLSSLRKIERTMHVYS